MTQKVDSWRYWLHTLGIHWWGEWSPSKDRARAGKLCSNHYRICQICGEIQREDARWA